MSNNLLNGLNNLANSFMELIQNNQRGGKVRSIINRNMKYLYDLIMNIDSHKKGYKSTIAELKTDFANPKPGDYAYVGETWTIWVEKNGQWVNSGKPISNDPEYMDELEKLKNRLYSEGVDEEYLDDLIPMREIPTETYLDILGTFFYENYKEMYGKYIDRIEFYATGELNGDGLSQAGMRINIAKHIDDGTPIGAFTYRNLKLVYPSVGFNSIDIREQLAADEFISFTSLQSGSRGSIIFTIPREKGENPVGGGCYYHGNWNVGPEFKLAEIDLGIKIVARIPAKSKGDILRLDDEKADKLSITPLKILTQSEYDNLAEKDDNTIYFIKEV